VPVLWISHIKGLIDSSPDDMTLAQSLLGSEQNVESKERIYLCPSCSSTLDVAHYLAQKDALDPFDSVLALRQWSGRGQLRRQWISEPGNLFVTWRLPQPHEQWSGLLPILVGFVLCQGLRTVGVDVFLKWPNDLLWQNSKVGGILIEERGDVLLAGIGLNLASCPEPFLLREDHAFPAQNLASALPDLTILELWLRLVHLAQFRYSFILSCFDPLEFVQFIEPVLAFVGTRVRIADHRSIIQGVYVGLSPDGGLILKTENTSRILYSGSLSTEKW
jgi:BirA family biotin operon repressor/biotin-[acetyl-CoA-carboxylase] ligase